MTYIIFAIAIIVLTIPITVLGKKHIYSIFLLVLNIFLMGIFSGIRYGVGTDFYTYQLIFQRIFTGGTPDDMEPLFYLLTYIIRTFTDNSIIFFIITSYIINGLIILILYKKSNNFTFSIFLYISMGFYFTSFNILRQFIAMAIMFYIINFSNKLKKTNIVIGSVIALGFHNTSIVMLLLLLFKKNVNSKKYIVIFFVVGILAYFMEPIIRNFVMTNKYEDYGDTIFFSYGTNIVHIIEYLGILLFYYMNCKKIISEEEKFYLMTISVGFVFIMLGLKGVLYNRIAIGFNLYNTLLLPKTINNIDNNQKRRITKFIFYTLFFIKFLLILRGSRDYSTNINFFYNEM